jgi:hypothetical protein
LKEGILDMESLVPWKLNFNDKEPNFWQWEQKWRAFYNFTGELRSAVFVTSFF